MGVRINMSTRKLTGRQLREFRSDVAKLKAKGLVSKNKDARKQAPTRYMLNQVAKYRDVLSGKAQVVKVASRKEAKEYDALYRTKGKAVVLPVSAKGERARYNPKTHEITSTYSRGEQRVTRHWPKTPLVEGTGELPRGGNVIYTIPFQGRGVFRTNDLADLYSMMRDLIASGWENVKQYVIVETIQNGRASLSGLS
jgi:hypothetical protein